MCPLFSWMQVAICYWMSEYRRFCQSHHIFRPKYKSIVLRTISHLTNDHIKLIKINLQLNKFDDWDYFFIIMILSKLIIWNHIKEANPLNMIIRNIPIS